tara:strand:- start:120 stop:248 length:129 start_codon:yes stop_codon:yes gene_type:complete
LGVVVPSVVVELLVELQLKKNSKIKNKMISDFIRAFYIKFND